MAPGAFTAHREHVPGPAPLDHCHHDNFAAVTPWAGFADVVKRYRGIAAGHEYDVAVSGIRLGLEHGFDVLLSQALADRCR